MKSQYIAYFLLLLSANISAENHFEVLSISNVPFPTSSDAAATLNASYSEVIEEFTVCYRFLVSFYNDGWLTLIRAHPKDNSFWDVRRLYEEYIGFNTGLEYEGFQYGGRTLYRNLPGLEFPEVPLPIWLEVNLPISVKTGKW